MVVTLVRGSKSNVDVMYHGWRVEVAHYALQVGANILVESVRPLTYSQPTSTNRLSIILIISITISLVSGCP